MAGSNTAPGTGSGANASGGTGSPQAAPSGDNIPNTTDLELETTAAPAAAPVAPRMYSETDMQKANRQAAEARTALATANKRLKEIDDANLSELDKEKQRAEAAEARANELEKRVTDTNRREVLTAAVKGICLDPAWFAEKVTAAELPFDAATGKPDEKLLTAKIAQLRGQYPGLFKAADGAADAGAQGDGTKARKDMNALMRGMFNR